MIKPQINTTLTAEGTSGNLSIIGVTNAAYVQRAVIVFAPHTEDSDERPKLETVFCMGAGENNAHMNVRKDDYSTDNGDFYHIGTDKTLKLAISLQYHPGLNWKDVRSKLDDIEMHGKKSVVDTYELDDTGWIAYDEAHLHVEHTDVEG